MTGPARIAAVLAGFYETVLELKLAGDACANRQGVIDDRIAMLEVERDRLDTATIKAHRVITNLAQFLGD